MSTTHATFTKLRSGDWGVKGTSLASGQAVTITKRDGSTSTVTIDRIIWTESDVSIASIKADRPASTRSMKIIRTANCGTRCQSCGTSSHRAGLHLARDLSGLAGTACRRCDDGSLSFC